MLNQTYQPIQLIVADDYSSDNSVMQIEHFIDRHPGVLFIKNEQNLGNCRTFNRALAYATGKYIIDLAADDVLLDTRIEGQVTLFEQLNSAYGVIFSDALHISESGKTLRRHYHNINKVPSGEIYADLVARYFICSPTMMIKKAVLDELGGYDETLAYEDFDFWVRSARNWKYFFQNEITTLKRKTSHSLSSRFRKRQNELQASTLVVCRKALALNCNEKENLALIRRVRYELRQAFRTQHFDLVADFAELLRILHALDLVSKFLTYLSRQISYF